MDPLFSARLHSTCSVRGGDGLAFVLHRDPRGVDAVGEAGADMGYGGLKDSLAVSTSSHARGIASTVLHKNDRAFVWRRPNFFFFLKNCGVRPPKEK